MMLSLPGVARVAAHQLDDLARVADRSVGQQEEQPGVSALHGLPQGPVERSQQVGPAHVCPHPPDVLAGVCQRVLAGAIADQPETNKKSYTTGCDVFHRGGDRERERERDAHTTTNPFHSVTLWGETFVTVDTDTWVARFFPLWLSKWKTI